MTSLHWSWTANRSGSFCGLDTGAAPAKIWAYCWFSDEAEGEDHTHNHLPVDHTV